MVSDLNAEFENAMKESPLPEKLDYDKIDEVVIEINKSILNKHDFKSN